MGDIDSEWRVLHNSVRALRGVRTTVAFVDVLFTLLLDSRVVEFEDVVY